MVASLSINTSVSLSHSTTTVGDSSGAPDVVHVSVKTTATSLATGPSSIQSTNREHKWGTHESHSVRTVGMTRTNRPIPIPTRVWGIPAPTPSAKPVTAVSNVLLLPRVLFNDITHLLYAFANVLPNGTVVSSNPVVDTQQIYDHSSTLPLSVKGSEGPGDFAAAAATEGSRRTFAQSAVRLVTDWGFDGLDVDWEYPASETDRDNFVSLITECRAEFNQYSRKNQLDYHFLVTVAASASPQNYEFVDFARMDRNVDLWHLMAYDYTGNWTNTTAHQANVYANPAHEAATKLNTDAAVLYYEAQGISPSKIVLGLPLYGRSFEGTSGLGCSYTTVGPSGGEYSYNTLPRPGAMVRFDDVAKATFSYDNRTRELVSYDDVRSTVVKAGYINKRHLAGAFFWEASGDRGRE
ncbi:endochitinase [Xylariaceae sp. FL0255]|nr:endochitinase [Xylariaceae sp. FL0255]